MKKIVLSFIVIMGISSVLYAEQEVMLEEDKGIYLGLAYSHLSHDLDVEGTGIYRELDFNAVMFEVGYKFNPYVAVTGRYNFSLGDSDSDNLMDSADLSVFSLFVKPMYPIAPEMDIYVLLGYSLTDASYDSSILSLDEGAFSWGAGASYDMTEDFSVFAEYTQFYNDTLNGFDHVVDGFNLGVNYKF